MSKKQSPEGIVSIMHTFEKAFSIRPICRPTNATHTQHYKCEKCAAKNIPFAWFAYLPVCLPTCQRWCAESAAPTLSYFYSLALYLVYVRALRIACEHLCVSHTEERKKNTESTHTMLTTTQR